MMMALPSRMLCSGSPPNFANKRLLRLFMGRYQAASVHTESRRRKATAVSAIEDVNGWKPVGELEADPCYKNLDLSFQNAQEAFKSKRNIDLVRALLVFNMCSIKPLVDYNKEILRFVRKVLGKTMFEKMMLGTFYGQFVAGEDEEKIKPTVERNRCFGVKSILDYSVEKDLSREEAQQKEMDSCLPEMEAADPKEIVRFRAHKDFGDRRENVSSARTYFYEDEAACDDNMKHFFKGIDAVSGATNSTGFAAIKLTALGRPQLLLQLSEVLACVRNAYQIISGGDWKSPIKRKDFERYLKSVDLSSEECQEWYTILDVSQDGEIDLLDWHNLLEVNVNLAKVLRVPSLQTGQMEPIAVLTEEEGQQMKNMLQRIDTIIKHAKAKDVRVMIDAEQTYFQAAINRLCMEMMRKYNKDKALVFNTYQCYLKDAYQVISTDLALSKREDFYFGAKLVRGAYMEQERLRAEALGYEDPINPSFEATTQMYEKVLSKVLKSVKQRPKGRIAVMVASHNEDTVRFTINKMKENGVHASDRIICFGQLLGMCDQVSFSLGQAGYSVYKYVPYGPVEEVIPYLSRRATENRGILDKVKKEKQLLRTELFRRLKNGQFFYKPPIPDVPLV